MTRKIQTLSFKERVYRVVSRIPRGETLTYKQVALRSGSRRAFRAVGTILSKNYNSKIPCHRVVRSNGQPGNYNRGKEKKIELLMAEKCTRT